jgi:hypothetical protein
MTVRRGSMAAALLVAMALRATPIDAVMVVPMTFEQLVAESVAVVYARVAALRGQWTADRRSIDSLATLEPLRYFKGDLGDHVVMRLPGGEAGGVINVIPGAPVVREGDLLVLFLGSRGPAIPSPLGLGQGIFRVYRDAGSGAIRVSPAPLKASPAGRILRGAVERRSLTLEAFAAAVRDVEAQP